MEKHKYKLIGFFACLFVIAGLVYIKNTFSPHPSHEVYARQQDEADPLKDMRAQFHMPQDKERELIYFNGNSLGLQCKNTKKYVERELSDWANLGVEGHFKKKDPWYTYHEQFRGPLSRLVGASENEVVCMNTLTVNLHLMMVSFYRPTAERFKILIEEPIFPSDLYAIKSQIKFHGYNPDDALVIVKPRRGEHIIRTEDIANKLSEHKIALVLLAGINYHTGQAIDFRKIARLAHDNGAFFGADLAHAIGNIQLKLNKWDVDFAVWCSYKYLNGGPGAVAGAFIHKKHHKNKDLPRLSGWWGNDPDKRFLMATEKEFIPVESADAWQVSNPPILSLIPLKASLEIFDKAGMSAITKKSKKMTQFMQRMLREIRSSEIEVITPQGLSERGAQFSILVKKDAKGYHQFLKEHGIVCDLREPNIIRIAPCPLYNSFQELYQFFNITKLYISGESKK